MLRLNYSGSQHYQRRTQARSGSGLEENGVFGSKIRHSSTTFLTFISRKFSLNGMSDDVLFSIAAAQLCQDTDLDDKRPRNLLGSARRRLTKLFLAQFRDKWEPSRQLWGASDYAWTGSVEFDKSSWKDVIFQYHMRVFTSWPHTRKWERLLGGGLKRESGTINADNTQKKTPKTVVEVSDPKLKLGIYEMRYSIALKTTWGLDFPVFTLVTMADAAAGSLQKNSRNNMNLGERNAWETAGICPLIRTTGVAALAFRIQSLLPQWEAHWSRLVDDIGKLLNANVSPPSLFSFLFFLSSLVSFFFTMVHPHYQPVLGISPPSHNIFLFPAHEGPYF